MKINLTPINGLLVVETAILADDRGSFSRLFCPKSFPEILAEKKIAQINSSLTEKVGAIRGLHFQKSPALETKFVRCTAGRVFDVAVDLRAKSSTFLQWYGIELSAKNSKLLVIPEGFAHGFQVLEENSEMLYLHTEFYCPEHEPGIHYNDQSIAIDWPLPCSEMSAKDAAHAMLNNHFTGLAT